MKPDLSRRQFLVHSASVAGALGLSGRTASAAADVEPLRLGFIGLGDRGRHLLNALLRLQADNLLPRVTITALSDVHPERLKRALETVKQSGQANEVRSDPSTVCSSDDNLPPVRGFSNYRALLDSHSVDAVFVATPVHLHGQQATLALHAGKHLYLEKPLAASVAECEELRTTVLEAEQKGTLFQIGLQRRYNPRYERSIRHLTDGAMGKPLFIRAQWHATGDSRKSKPWIFRREKSGDIVVEQACHQFDIFNWVFDAEPERMCGFGGTHSIGDQPPGRDTMDHYGLVIEYPGGAKVNFSHLSFAVPDRRFSGIYELVFTADGGIDLANAQVWSRVGESRRLETPSGNDTQIAIASFVDSIRRRERPLADIEIAYRATLTSLLGQRALDVGGTVSWQDLQQV